MRTVTPRQYRMQLETRDYLFLEQRADGNVDLFTSVYGDIDAARAHIIAGFVLSRNAAGALRRGLVALDLGE